MAEGAFPSLLDSCIRERSSLNFFRMSSHNLLVDCSVEEGLGEPMLFDVCWLTAGLTGFVNSVSIIPYIS